MRRFLWFAALLFLPVVVGVAGIVTDEAQLDAGDTFTVSCAADMLVVQTYTATVIFVECMDADDQPTIPPPTETAK